MLEKFKKRWRAFKDYEPGNRFQRNYQERKDAGQGPLRKIGFIAVGVLVIAGGIIMLVIPGPGIVAIFIGGGLIAQESLVAARVLDWSEVRLRRLYQKARAFWGSASVLTKAALIAVALVLAAGAAYAGYWYFFVRG